MGHYLLQLITYCKAPSYFMLQQAQTSRHPYTEKEKADVLAWTKERLNCYAFEKIYKEQ